MSKELEALERGIIEFEKDLEDDCNNEWLKRVVAGMKKCYQRLEQIDNANPSEALECLEYLGNEERSITESEPFHYQKLNFIYEEYFEPIKQVLLKAQEQEKVLEILFKKQVDLGWLWYCIHECINSLNEYNKKMPIEKFKLTEEEFDTLKRYFE